MTASRAASRIRLLPSALLVACGGLLIVANDAFRSLEARCAQPVVALATGSTSGAVRDVVFFGLGTDHSTGLRITTGCTTAGLLVPFLLVMAAIVAKSTVPVVRVLVVTALGALMLLAVNVLRLTVIAWATSMWGLGDGFEISHVLIGSILAVAGFAGTLVVSVRLLVRGGKPGLLKG